MRYYFAPMEGITGYIHRNAYQTCFPGIDKYFTAFIAPNQKGKLSQKEKNDILPVHNEGMHTVPQLLTNSARDFIQTAELLKGYGYSEINLNLGCPSRTVVSKYRGSGFLAKREELDAFLETVFGSTDMKISIKTRTGVESGEEFYRLIEIYNKYPLKELIIHPRTQQDYYQNKPDWKVFGDASALSRCPVCYNGDIFAINDYRLFREHFPQVETIMIGRGLLVNPGLIGMVKGEGMPDKERIRTFHDKVYTGYREVMCGEKPVLYKMKELWAYMIHIFTDGGKYFKKIKKAERLAAYEEAVEALFRERGIMPEEA